MDIGYGPAVIRGRLCSCGRSLQTAEPKHKGPPYKKGSSSPVIYREASLVGDTVSRFLSVGVADCLDGGTFDEAELVFRLLKNQ